MPGTAAAREADGRAERIAGAPEARLVQAAHLLGEAATAVVLTGRGPEQQSHGPGNALAGDRDVAAYPVRVTEDGAVPLSVPRGSPPAR